MSWRFRKAFNDLCGPNSCRYGLSREYEIGGLYKTAISAQVVMGSLDIQRVIVARGMLARARTG
jgi:alkylation response protein AidB-like acyl-CoA dehydrogenase